MRILSFLRYSAESILRNRRRSLYAITGVVLAISLVSGSFIAVDSSALGLLRAAIKDVRVDFVGRGYISDGTVDEPEFDEAIEALESVDNVDMVLPVGFLEGWFAYAPGGDGAYDIHYYVESIALIPEDADTLMSKLGISGEAPSPGTVAISMYIVEAMGIGVGDTITLSKEYWDYQYNGTSVTSSVEYVNVTLEVSEVWISDEPSEYDYSTYSVRIGNMYSSFFVNMEDSDLFMEPLVEQVGDSWCRVDYLVWIDRDKVITVGNVDASILTLQRMENRLNFKGSEWGIEFFASPLIGPLEGLSADLAGTKVIFFALSAPVMALGVYLSIVGVELGMTHRRREIGVLKSRGASNRQVLSGLVLESLLLGIGAGLLGLAGGLVASRFIIDAAEMSFTEELSTQSQWSDIIISSSTVTTTMFFGILLMLLSAYRPMHRISKMPVSEALHHYTPSTGLIRYKMRYDIAALMFVGLSMWAVFAVQGAWGFSSQSFIVEVIFVILLLVGVAMIPIAPFLLTVSIVRMLTRGTSKLYTRFTWFFRRWTRELHYIVDKNIARNPRRASNMCIIVALAVAFGLFVSITMESVLAEGEREAYMQVGADLRLTTYSENDTVAVQEDIEERVLSVEGVDRVCTFYETNMILGHVGWNVAVAMIDSEAYSEVVAPSDAYFEQCGNEVLRDLSEEGTVILAEYYAEDMGIIKGDIVPASLTTYEWFDGEYVPVTQTVELLVLGFFDNRLPGLQFHAVCVDIDTLWPIVSDSVGSSVSMFVDIGKNADPHSAGENITAVLAEIGFITSIEYHADVLDRIVNYPAYKALADFLYLEYALTFVIMSVGVGLIIFVTVSDREQELACILARGASGDQMRRLLLGESLSLMLVGIVVGVSVGLLSAFMFSKLAWGDAAMGTFTFSLVSWAVVLCSVASFVAASMLATVRAGRMRLSEVLRIRGG